MKRHHVITLSLTLGLLGAGQAHADQVEVPVGQQNGARDVGPVPTNGMTQENVRERFGQPQGRKAPVGDPPISSWEYADYVVYFEHDRVLRAVVKHRPQAGTAPSTSTDG